MSTAVQLESTLTCPDCGHAGRELMPSDVCVVFWDCPPNQRRERGGD